MALSVFTNIVNWYCPSHGSMNLQDLVRGEVIFQMTCAVSNTMSMSRGVLRVLIIKKIIELNQLF